MDTLQFDSIYMKFIKSLPKECNDLNIINNSITNNIEDLCHELGICKLVYRFDIPTIGGQSNKSTHEVVLWDSGRESAAPYEKTFSQDKYLKTSYLCYPEADSSFFQDKLCYIDFLIEHIFLFSNRASLRSLIDRVSLIDFHTGLFNILGVRKYSEDFVKNNCDCGQYCSGALNIKDFSYTNHSLGQKGGDIFLHEFGRLLNEIIPKDGLIARLGGDNFFFVVRKDDLEAFIAEVATLTIIVDLDDNRREVPVKFRIGLYNMESGDNIDDSIPLAMAALAAARKSIDQGIVIYEPSLLEHIQKQKFVIENFYDAIKRKEFVVFYQPKVDNRTKMLCGAEALVRWICDGTIVSPKDFVPVLERDGNICILDFYVLEQVCKDILGWLEKGIDPVRTSVNFSRLHLHSKHFASDILSIIDRYGIDHKYIEIELTESSGYEDFQAFSSFISKMKENNIATSIDDFGTGYSSLNLLRDLNADTVKLDKSFIDKFNSLNKADDVIISAIINMAHELEMSVITEGVETVEQAAYLQDKNCYHIQGFLYDRPLAPDIFEGRLKNKKYK